MIPTIGDQERCDASQSHKRMELVDPNSWILHRYALSYYSAGSVLTFNYKLHKDALQIKGSSTWFLLSITK